MPFDVLRGLLRALRQAMVFLAIRPIVITPSNSKTTSLNRPKHDSEVTEQAMRPLNELKEEVVTLCLSPCNTRRMLFMSSCLRREYLAKLQSSSACMLPSFCHALPTGQETGTFVALDLGGSTFRVALVELRTRDGDNGGMSIKRMSVNKIDESVRRLPADDFFDWMAQKIQHMLADGTDCERLADGVVPLGIAWSFPIEQTSHRGGKLQYMGKGFRCHEGRIGHDLGSLIETAAAKRGLRVRVEAIVNDSSATLLSQAYLDPSTSMGLILGTGTNAAFYLPVFSLGHDKFGVREPSWFQRAEKVIVNTELSMFGKGILSETRWDRTVSRTQPQPDYQPLEYMTTGRYLGEILRLIIAEAVETCGLFDGTMPEALCPSYSIDTALLALIEDDLSAGCRESATRVQQDWGLSNPPSPSEMTFIKACVESVSRRAAAYIATSLHALWAVQKETETEINPDVRSSRTSIASNGSVILKYPGFRSRCQSYIADLIAVDTSTDASLMGEQVVLEPTTEAAVFGAAVAVAMAEDT